jgi:hypothetical protein
MRQAVRRKPGWELVQTPAPRMKGPPPALAQARRKKARTAPGPEPQTVVGGPAQGQVHRRRAEVPPEVAKQPLGLQVRGPRVPAPDARRPEAAVDASDQARLERRAPMVRTGEALVAAPERCRSRLTAALALPSAAAVQRSRWLAQREPAQRAPGAAWEEQDGAPVPQVTLLAARQAQDAALASAVPSRVEMAARMALPDAAA